MKLFRQEFVASSMSASCGCQRQEPFSPHWQILAPSSSGQHGCQGVGREPGLLPQDAPGDSWNRCPGAQQPALGMLGPTVTHGAGCQPGSLRKGFSSKTPRSSPAHQPPPSRIPSGARNGDGVGPWLRMLAARLLDVSTTDQEKEL